jgi:hypothetical protein
MVGSSVLQKVSLRPYKPLAFGDLVRVGRDNDGGYVLPRRVIERSNVLLSLGVNDDWSFEAGALEINGKLRVVCVDGTTSTARVARKAMRKAVDMVGHLMSFQKEKLRRNASYLATPLRFHRFFSQHELLRLMVARDEGPGVTTLPALFTRVAASPHEWVLLKVDIEGAEYDVLSLPGDRYRRVAALLVEFHDLGRNWRRMEECVAELLQTFEIAHIHGNNFAGVIPGTGVPAALEFSFVHRSFAPESCAPSGHAYPIAGLDMPNNWQRPDLPLAFD